MAKKKKNPALRTGSREEMNALIAQVGKLIEDSGIVHQACITFQFEGGKENVTVVPQCPCGKDECFVDRLETFVTVIGNVADEINDGEATPEEIRLDDDAPNNRTLH